MLAIVGAGSVGGAFGGRLIELGYEVIYGSRDPRGEDVQKLVEDLGAKASVVSIKDAVLQADMIFLVTL